MGQDIDLTQTFMDAVGDLRGKVDWDRRLGFDAMQSFGSADGSFGDVISMTHNGRFDGLGFTTLLFGYGVLLHDTKTPREIISRLLPPLTEAFVKALTATTLDQQDMGDLINFMDHYNKARASGRFDAADKAEIGQVMRVMADNFSAKCQAEHEAKHLAETVSGLREGLKQDIKVSPSLKLKP